MKKILLPVLILVSTNAFAMHAYRGENCIEKNSGLTFGYKGNYPHGGDYGISLPGQDNNVIALPSEENYPGNPDEAGTDVFFTETSSKIIENKVETSECWFDYADWTSEKTINIDSISASAAKILGLKKGDILNVICEENTAYPNGKACEDE